MNDYFGLEVLVNLADQLSGPISQPLARIEEFKGAIAQADVAMNQMQAGMGILAGGVLLVAPFALATKSAIEFETAFADVKKVIGDDLDAPGLQNLSRELISLSFNIPLTAAGLTDITAAAGQAGIAVSELTDFTENASKVAVAFDIAAGSAGDGMAFLQNNYKLTTAETLLLADGMNALSNGMASRASDILNVTNRLSGMAAQSSLTAVQVAALSSAMLSAGTAPEVVATGLNAMLSKLGAASTQSKDMRAQLEMLGFSTLGMEQAIRTNATGAIRDLLVAVNNSSNPLKALTNLFGLEYADDIARMANNLNLYDQALGMVAQSGQYAGSVQSEFASRSATTENQLTLLQNRLTAIGIVMGAFFLPTVNAVIGGIQGFLEFIYNAINAVPGLAQVMSFVGVGAGALVIALGLLVLGIGAVSFASAQARIGMGFLSGIFTDVMARATATTTSLIATGAAARGLSLEMMAADGIRMTGMQSLSLLAGGLRVQFMNAATAVRAFTMSLLTNPVFLLIAAVVALGASFVWAWNNVAEFRDNVMAIFAPLSAGWSDLVGSFNGFLESLGFAAGPLQSFKTIVTNAFGEVMYWVGFVLGFIVTLLVIVFARVVQGAMQFASGFLNVISGVVNLVVGLLTGDMDRARMGVDLIWQGIARILGAPLRLLGVNWWAVRDTLNGALQWVYNLNPRFFDAGANILRGLWEGLKSVAGGIIDFFGGLARSMQNAFTTPNKIESPSRVFFGYATMIGAGLLLGFANMVNPVRDAVGALVPTPEIASSVTVTPRLEPLEFTAPPPIVTPQIAPVNAPATLEPLPTPQLGNVDALTAATLTLEPQFEAPGAVPVPNIGLAQQLDAIADLENQLAANDLDARLKGRLNAAPEGAPAPRGTVVPTRPSNAARAPLRFEGTLNLNLRASGDVNPENAEQIAQALAPSFKGWLHEALQELALEEGFEYA